MTLAEMTQRFPRHQVAIRSASHAHFFITMAPMAFPRVSSKRESPRRLPSLLRSVLGVSAVTVVAFSSFGRVLIGPQAFPQPSYAEARQLRYNDWKELAMNLAKLTPNQILHELRTTDPFGTRTFEAELMKRESEKGEMLTQEEVRQLFSCPIHRITLPDQRNQSQAQAFRNNEEGTFLYLQHLRKAGGTHFCSLSRDNLPQHAVDPYFCMSDYAWSKKDDSKRDCAGCLKQWNNTEIATRMKQAGHRITGNEWNNFDRLHHFDLPAIFATSFRRPVDRALSQFRFECLEHRGCKIQDVEVWWSRARYLWNVYTKTFADVPYYNVQVYESNSTESQEKRAQLLGDALDTVSKFHLVLSMEWLAYAKPQVESVLGFHNTSALTHRVRPHNNLENLRQDGQEHNTLGAAGIAKASLVPEEYLTPEQYQNFSEHLALDEILTDFARRLFLERMACDDLISRDETMLIS